MNWGLIGCGVIGERRVLALPETVRLTHCFDPVLARAQKISELAAAEVCESAEALLNPKKIQAVIIAAINSELSGLVQLACDRGIHVLVEKPVGRSLLEVQKIKARDSLVKVGFNHRFHPAFAQLKNELGQRPEDPILFVRAQYGNGARLGFEKEWRSQVPLAGGGELLDQGVHILDLASVLLPTLQVVAGFTRTHFWSMPVDDNSWAILADKESGATLSMHVSSSEWKNEFRFEVYTRNRKYQWLGLGRSYGPEKLIVHQMKPEMGPPETTTFEFPPEDDSWKKENANFFAAIRGQGSLNGDLADAVKTLKLVDDIYNSSLQLYEQKQLPYPHPEWAR